MVVLKVVHLDKLKVRQKADNLALQTDDYSAAWTAELMVETLDTKMVSCLVEWKAHPKVAQMEILTVRHWAD